MGGQRGLVGDGAVEHNDLATVAPGQPGVVPDPQRGHHQGHERGDEAQGGGLDAAHEAQGEGGEEVGDLALGYLGRAQADD